MTRLLLASALAALAAVSSTARAAEPAPGPAGGDPMAAWTPPKVTQPEKDKKEIRALLARMEAASMKGDLDAAAALVDFPVTMVTDDKKGEASGEAWTRERWMEVMKPFYKPMPDMKMTHKPTVTLLSDSLALVADEWTMTMGKQRMTGRNGMVLVRKGGEWKAKAMVEGGWGDAMAAGNAK